MKMCKWVLQKKKQWARRAALLATAVAARVCAMAQDGNAGINSATTQVKSYFDTGCNLMYAIGAVTGIIGAIKV